MPAKLNYVSKSVRELDALKSNILWECSKNPKQELFLSCPADESFYGGAAGGGKTDAILISSTGDDEINIFSNPNWRALMLRRTLKEHEKSLVLRSLQLFSSRGKFDSNRLRWIFPPNGGLLQLGHIKNENDVYKYRSQEYNLIAFDELTDFTEHMFLFILSRLRTIDPKIKCKVKAASNPTGIGHVWVKKRYIDGKEPYKIYTEILKTLDGKLVPWSKCFIPATVFDNQYLMAKNSQYARILMELPEIEKQAFLYGNWNVFSGQFFGDFSEENICDDFKFSEDWPIWISMDYGFSTKCSIGFYTQDPETKIYYRWSEIYTQKANPDDLVILMKEKLKDRKKYLVGCFSDKRISVKDEYNSISTRERFAAGGFFFIVCSENRIPGWHRARELLLKDEYGETHFKVFRSCENFIRLIPTQIHDSSNPEDLRKSPHSHIADEFRFFAISRKPDISSSFFTENFIKYTSDPITGYIGTVGESGRLRDRIKRFPGLKRENIIFSDNPTGGFINN